MKRSTRLLVLISFLLVSVLLNVILFLTVDDARLDTAVFWMAWAFAFPWNLLAAVLIFFWTAKGDALIKLPVAQTVSYAAFVVYLVLGLIFMYLPIEKITFPLILELIVTVAYILIAMYSVYAVNYIGENQKKTKQKVLYIRMLQADVLDCVPLTQDAAICTALNDLAESIRFSDPMSHPALAGVEGELSLTVSGIAASLREGDTQKAAQLIATAKAQLESRNKRCIMLK
ncbi:MAG: hypothetical protein J6B09_04155 [Clostridia bacterium]|nr:hypothetical protein [Clostridia bacterium]